LTPSKHTRLVSDFKSSPSKRASEVTPSVAATTAAALNAERAAQKLKSALLRARKEPLLNKQAEQAPVPPSDLDLMAKHESIEPPKEFVLGSSLFNSTSGMPQTPQWSLPLLPKPPSPPSSSHIHHYTSRHRESKLHQRAPPLKKSSGPSDLATSPPPAGFTSPPANFTWGPLPSIAPKTTLSHDVRKKEEGPSKLPFSLSSSWVTDDFDTKK
jgi:nucleoporin NUP159